MSTKNSQFSNNTLKIINVMALSLLVNDLDSRNKNFYSDRGFIDFKEQSK
ncbi:hypothetical protein [Helicobacter pylori]|nr:hypothetical protein [Helicobacter pylori]